jgi:hypothetical protein
MSKFFGVFSKEVLGSKSVTLAVVALAAGFLIGGVALFLFSFTSVTAGQGSWSLNLGSMTTTVRGIVFAAFLLPFVSIWFLLYVMYNREADDIYSGLREKLVGVWSVQYELAPGQTRITPLTRIPAMPCAIEVNPETKKLEIHFDIRNHALFEDGEQVIQTIALVHDVNNRYSMSYYYSIKRSLNLSVSQHILSEDDDESTCSELDVEIFAALSFEDVRASKTIDEFSGKWFDLNGNLIRLFSLVSEIQDHGRDKEMYKKRLSDARIDRDNFAALMGEITFYRTS